MSFLSFNEPEMKSKNIRDLMIGSFYLNIKQLFGIRHDQLYSILLFKYFNFGKNNKWSDMTPYSNDVTSC